jgi:hypothetical protein
MGLGEQTQRGFHMRPIRNALLSACAVAIPLGLAVAAHAQSQAHGIMLYTADGTPIGILTPIQNGARVNLPAANFAPAPTMPGALSIAQIVQRQDALMDRLLADMRAMFDAPFAVPAMPAIPGGNGHLTVPTFSYGPGATDHGYCGQTVTYTFNGRNSEPAVQVQKVGTACGTLDLPSTRTVPAASEVAPRHTPAFGSPQARTYDITYRQPAAAPTRPRL